RALRRRQPRWPGARLARERAGRRAVSSALPRRRIARSLRLRAVGPGRLVGDSGGRVAVAGITGRSLADRVAAGPLAGEVPAATFGYAPAPGLAAERRRGRRIPPHRDRILHAGVVAGIVETCRDVGVRAPMTGDGMQ